MLYDLIKCKRSLDETISFFEIEAHIQERHQSLINLSDTPSYTAIPDIRNNLQEIALRYKGMFLESRRILRDLNAFKDSLQGRIDQIIVNFNGADYENRFEKYRPRLLPVYGQETETIIRSRISSRSDWHYPGLVFNPREKKFIDYMTACDPLYITHYSVEHTDEKIEDLISHYADVYQKRLRIHEIDDLDFSCLPQQQFSFILCWNHFNYQTLSSISRYLIEFKKLLRPGGVLMFSYNNCELEDSAGQAENGSESYATYALVKELCIQQGFEIINNFDMKVHEESNLNVSWIEIQLPGTLSTVKAHQVLGEVKEK